MRDDEATYDHTFEAGPDDQDDRLDVFLVKRFPERSRTFLALQITEDRVAVNGQLGKRVRPGRRVEAGDVVQVRLVERPPPSAAPEPIPLEILHEDDSLLAIDKPPGLVVHPGSGQHGGTLANALAHHCEQLSTVQGPLRPGIVHRLDKDTSGVILVAKDDATHVALSAQFKERTVKKEYLAVVRGVLDLDADLVSAPIGPHKRHATRMAVRIDTGRASETYLEVAERFRGASALRCFPKTGRTHQIRVHLSSIRHPILGDRVYGGYVPALSSLCGRQALHARRITFEHPATSERLTIEAPVPADIEALLAHLRGL